MRILIATTANEGHFSPLVALARAASEAGHEVRVAAPASFADAVRRAGLPHVPFADAPPELVGPVMARLPTLSFDEADSTVIREVFGRIDAQAAYPAVDAAIAAWRPDVLVREPAELGSLAAAVRAGVPHVQVAIGMTEMTRLLARHLRDPLVELAQLAGLPDDALMSAVAGETSLSPVPELLDSAGDDAYDTSAVALRFRDPTPAPSGPRLPTWGDPDLPLVYVTFGSVTGSLPPFAGVYREVLDGVAELPIRVLMTVGRRVEPTGLGPIPVNTRVEPWWPQSAVLAEAALVLGHGGFGTTMGALAAGVPQVVAPLFTSDQVANARHVAAVGAGHAVPRGPGVGARACAEILKLLSDPAYRVAAEGVAAAIAALPPVADAVAFLERG